jgi:hypothetical protein
MPLKFTSKTFFFIVLFIVVFVRVRLADMPMERDEGEYAYAAMQILRGKLPYLEFYNMKLPGVYYTYAAIFTIAGSHIAAIRITVLLLNLLTGFFLFKLVKKRFLDADTPWLVAGFFGILSLSMNIQGVIANCEHFLIFFAFFGLWLLSEKKYFLAGIALSLSVLMKQQGLVFSIFAVLIILFEHFEGENISQILRGYKKNALEKKYMNPKALHKLSINLSVFFVGFSIPVLGLLGYIYYKNIFPQFYFYTYEYAKAYSSIIEPSFKYISNFKYIFLNSPILWLIFFIIFFKLLLSIFKPFLTAFYRKNDIQKHVQKATTHSQSEEVGLITLWFGSFVAVCAGWYFREHYFQIIVPASALLLAFGWKILFPEVQKSSKMLLLVLLSTVIIQINYFFVWSPEVISRKIYLGEAFSEFKDLGYYLNHQVKASEKIGTYGCDPQVWFYSNREGASGFLYAYPLQEKQPFAEKMTSQFIEETEKTRPEWFVYSHYTRFGEYEKTTKQLHDWLMTYTKKNYTVKGYLYENEDKKRIWQWDISNLDMQKTDPMIVVYKRKI